VSNAHVRFPERELIKAVDAVTAALDEARKATLELIGTQLLEFSQLDYQAKSHGGTGDDGVRWAPITVGTVLARERKAGHIKSKKKPGAKKSVVTIAKTRKENKKHYAALANAGVSFRRGGKEASKNDRHKAGTTVHASAAVRNKQIATGSYQIGIDTGLQANSARPGYVTPDGKGGNVLKLTDTEVTIGYGRSYSEYFDRHRKLLPEIMPAEWIEALEEIVAHEGGRVVQQTFDRNGLST
jgi:hypothetical protein